MSDIISIHERISFARFRYFLFPSVIIGEKLDKELKSINPNYTEYDLLSNLDYVTVDMNKDIDILSKTLSRNEELIKDLIKGASYAFIKEKYDYDSIEIKEFLINMVGSLIIVVFHSLHLLGMRNQIDL